MDPNFPKGSAEFINRLNKIKVLNLIRETGEISRAAIVKQTGLSAPTVTRIVDSLINTEKLAQQVGIGESSGGRPPLMVRFNGEESYVIGVDWGRTHIYGVLANLNGDSLVELDILTEVSEDFNKDLQRVIDLIEEILRRSGIQITQLKGIGLAAAGFINKKNHIVEYSPNFNWKNVDIMQPLVKHFHVPVMVDNVSRVMAQGELLYGIGEDFKDFIFINVGFGIGAGIISNGRPFFGFDGMAGEIGHNHVVGAVADGRKCSCGKMDCLESYASGRGICEIGWQQKQFYPHSMLNSVSHLSAEIIAGFANEGDELAIQLFTQAADYLGLAIAAMANAFNPAAIVLGGKVMKAGPFFTQRIKHVFEREAIQQPNRKITLLMSKLGDEAAVKGAVSLILSNILNFRV